MNERTLDSVPRDSRGVSNWNAIQPHGKHRRFCAAVVDDGLAYQEAFRRSGMKPRRRESLEVAARRAFDNPRNAALMAYMANRDVEATGEWGAAWEAWFGRQESYVPYRKPTFPHTATWKYKGKTHSVVWHDADLTGPPDGAAELAGVAA